MMPATVLSSLEAAVIRVLHRAVRLHTGEVALVVHSFWWGVWAWRSTRSDGPTGYSMLAAFAPEWVLGSVSIGLGIVSLSSHWLRKPVILRVALMAGFAWSAFLAGCFSLLNSHYSAVPTYGSLAVVYAFAYFKECARGGG